MTDDWSFLIQILKKSCNAGQRSDRIVDPPAYCDLIKNGQLFVQGRRGAD